MTLDLEPKSITQSDLKRSKKRRHATPEIHPLAFGAVIYRRNQLGAQQTARVNYTIWSYDDARQGI